MQNVYTFYVNTVIINTLSERKERKREFSDMCGSRNYV
jgi:hypothetical protein